MSRWTCSTEGLSLRIVISENEGTPLTNIKIISQISSRIIWNWKSRLFKGQDQIQLKRIKGVVRNVIMSKYEDNPLENNKVISNNNNIQAYCIQ